MSSLRYGIMNTIKTIGRRLLIDNLTVDEWKKKNAKMHWYPTTKSDVHPAD